MFMSSFEHVVQMISECPDDENEMIMNSDTAKLLIEYAEHYYKGCVDDRLMHDLFGGQGNIVFESLGVYDADDPLSYIAMCANDPYAWCMFPVSNRPD